MKELFHEFRPVEKSIWEQKIQQDLKIDNACELLDISFESEIIQSAYCDFSEQPSASWLKNYQQSAARFDHAWQGARYWLNVECLEHHDATTLNNLSLNALRGGADVIELRTNNNDWDSLLDQVSIPDCHLALQGSIGASVDFINHLSKQGAYKGYVVIDQLPNHLNPSLIKLLELSHNQPGVRCLGLKEASDGSDSLLRLAQLLSTTIFLINELLDLGVSLQTIVSQIQLEVQMGDQYLWEICRLRSLRMLFHQMITQYGYKEYRAEDLMIKATATNGQGLTKNSNHQMLQNTNQGMAAILGGCNLFSALPTGGYASTDPVERRISRNVGLILREESHLHQVADPAAGSYYLESLTAKIARKIWSELQNLERLGGFKALSN